MISPNPLTIIYTQFTISQQQSRNLHLTRLRQGLDHQTWVIFCNHQFGLRSGEVDSKFDQKNKTTSPLGKKKSVQPLSKVLANP